MPPPVARSVNLKGAKCLMADTDRVRVALVQPVGTLVTAERRGPHYGEEERDTAIKRCYSFLEVARSCKADLVVAPEYFSPHEVIKRLLAEPTLLRKHALYVLPVESLSRESFSQLVFTARERGFDVQASNLDFSASRYYVNCCAIFHRRSQHRILLLQAKTYGAFAEKPSLIPGKDFFLIEGENNSCLVLLCSDGNNQSNYRAWTTVAHQKPGAIVIHCQCNRRPDYSQHEALWADFLHTNLGKNRLFFSVNWGTDTKIQDDDGLYEIKTPRSRIIRGKPLQQSPSYTNRSTAGLHYECRRHNRSRWEMWHLSSPEEHCIILDMVPPFESVPSEQQYRDKGVLMSQILRSTNSGFSRTDALDLTRYFWINCEVYGVNQSHYSNIEGVPLSDLERFCNSCLLRRHGSWLSKDIAVRIPTAQLTCLSDDSSSCNNTDLPCCSGRDDWLDETQFVCQCLKKFNRTSFSNQFQLTVDKTFPLNVTRNDNAAVGWLFHAGGRTARALGKIIGDRLNHTNINETKRKICLFAVGEYEQLEKKDLFPTPIASVLDTDVSGQDILDLSHHPDYAIFHL